MTWTPDADRFDVELVGRAIGLRPAVSDDDARRREIFRDVTSPQFEPLGLPPEAVAALCDQQYTIRSAQYAAAFPTAQHFVIEDDDETIGQLIVADELSAITIVDISIVARETGRGVGTAVLRAVTDFGDDADRPIVLTVVRTNPARRLYERNDFEVVESNETHHRMRRRPRPRPAAATTDP